MVNAHAHTYTHMCADYSPTHTYSILLSLAIQTGRGNIPPFSAISHPDKHTHTFTYTNQNQHTHTHTHIKYMLVHVMKHTHTHTHTHKTRQNSVSIASGPISD